jgi:hypothetical protein
MQQEMAAQQSATDRGLSETTSATIDLEDAHGSDIIDEFADPDIARDSEQGFSDIDELLAAEFGRHLAFGNIDSKEYSRQKKLDRGRARLTKMEFPREGRIGHKCSGLVREIMVPDEAERPALTDDAGRQIDAAFEERGAMRSLSKDARGFRGVTEAIVETLTRSDNDKSGSGGGFIRRLFG